MIFTFGIFASLYRWSLRLFKSQTYASGWREFKALLGQRSSMGATERGRGSVRDRRRLAEWIEIADTSPILRVFGLRNNNEPHNLGDNSGAFKPILYFCLRYRAGALAGKYQWSDSIGKIRLISQQ
jgi:hypothetical protein